MSRVNPALQGIAALALQPLLGIVNNLLIIMGDIHALINATDGE